jgi:DNA polymerase-3 subunit alpha
MYFACLDSETTGLNTSSHSIVQLSCIPVIDGVRQKPFNEFCQPENYLTVEEKAVQVHGITIARMRTFQKPEKMLDNFIQYLKSFGVKFYIMGFNVGFDKRFLSSMFNRYGREKEFFELFELSIHDTYTRAQSLKKTALKDQKSFSLAALCERFNIHINAHDALSDIGATIELDDKIAILLGENARQKDSLESVLFIPEFPEPAQLHLHSSYSMVESVPTIDNWAKWAKENNVPAIAIADHSYAISLYETNTLNTPDKDGIKKYGDLGILHSIGLYFQVNKRDTLYPFNAWAKNLDGFNNIMKLSTLGFTNEVDIDGVRRAVVDIGDIKKHSEGLIFGFGDPDFILGEVVQEGSGAFEEAFNTYREVFDGLEVFVEMMPISITNTYSKKLSFQPVKDSDLCRGDAGYAVLRALFDCAVKYQLPMIPVSGAHFIPKEDKLLQDCLASSSYKSGKNYHEVYSAKLSKEMYVLLKGILGDRLNESTYLSWVNNSLDIAERCKNVYKKYQYQLPIIEIPQHIKDETDDYNKQLLMLTIEKCQSHGRWKEDPVYLERFSREIGVIAKNKTLNFLPYFLMYEDISAEARKMGILCGIARGSAGGSLLSYYLKIIHIDPIAANLPFERFLSHERIGVGSFPDIDSDFAKRDQVVAYLQRKYGLGFAQIATFSKMKTKTAIKQVMMALYGKNARDPEVNDICMLIPDSPQGIDEKHFLYGYTDKEGLYHPGIVEMNQEIARFFQARPAVKNMTDRLIGITRGLNRHASGFIISSYDLSQGITPLMYILSDNIYMTQMAAPMLEKCGLIKADLLSINTLQMVQDAISLIKKRHDKDLMVEDASGVAAIYRLPNSKKVFREFRAQNTDSSFQFNSDLIKSLLPGFAPTTRDDLSNLTALGRPGTLDLMVEPGISATHYYIAVRQGDREPKYIHPDLEPILKHTHSVVAFQEQLLEILVRFAGYTLGEADQIRSAIAKKKKDVMVKAYEKVRVETQKKGWTLEQANELCDILSAYSNYSFNLSHSCIAYYSEVLTANGNKKMCDLSINDRVATIKNGQLEYNNPEEVLFQGNKEIYEFTLEDGSTMNMTSDHQVHTALGWLPVMEAFNLGLDIDCI